MSPFNAYKFISYKGVYDQRTGIERRINLYFNYSSEDAIPIFPAVQRINIFFLEMIHQMSAGFSCN